MSAPYSIRHIQDMNTTVTTVPRESTGVHESCLRAWNILEYVKWLLERKVPPEVITELIREMERR